MPKNEIVPSNADMAWFVDRHYRRLIAMLRQRDSGYSPALADALSFLVDHVEYFPLEDSHFDSQLYGEIIEWMRKPVSSQPLWLADALELLVREIYCFPVVGNSDAYVVEYIYPH